MSQIVGFLLERIAEDEADAMNWRRRVVNDEFPRGAYEFLVKRIKAECEVKRRMVLWAHAARLDVDSVDGVLAPLALIYADHPDYDEGWQS